MTPTPISTAASLEQDGWRARERPGFIGLVGPMWTRREGDSWAYGILAGPQHLNPGGVVHGGLLGSLLDHALSTVAWEACGRRPCLTVQLDTQFVAAAREGQFLEARAQVVRATSSLVFMQAQMTVGPSLISVASAVMKVLDGTA